MGNSPELIGFVYTVRGVSYKFVNKSACFQKGALPSRIWTEGYPAENEQLPGFSVWVCARCWNRRNSKGIVDHFKCYSIGKPGNTSTKHALNHLRKHKMVEETQQQRPLKRQRNVYEQLAYQTVNNLRPTQLEVNSGREKLLQWIIAARISLHSIELEEFRSLIQTLSPAIGIYLQPSRNTIRDWIMERFYDQRQRVKEEMHKSISKIHLSFDLWTSESSLPLIGVVAHYLTSNHINQARFIGMRLIEGPHTGENQAGIIAEIVNDYEISDQLGYFITDNAGNNDTAINSLCQTLGLESHSRRLRCLGHIINLAVQAFLYGKKAESFEVEMHNLDLKKFEEKHYQELLLAWRKKGAIGKLHNLIIWIRRTPQRRQQFKSIELKEDIPPSSQYKIFTSYQY